MDLLTVLGEEIGVRQAGTPEAGRAADAVADALRELGLEPRFQEFHLLGYEAEEPELQIDGERWDAGPCVYAHPTDGAVEGRVRQIGMWKIGGFFPEAPAFAVEDDTGRELARIHTSPFGGAAIPFLAGARQISVGPTVFISGADSRRLAELEGARARVDVRGRFVPGRIERNVVAELTGERAAAVIVSAHFDSVWRGPGVIDNASGVEGVRRVAERLRGGPLPRTVIFCAFAAEEIGLLGARNYVYEAQLRGELERIQAVVNLDCIAYGERFELLATPAALGERARALAESLGLAERYRLEPGPAGPGVDAYPFVEAGVPAISILHFPYPEYHLPSERRELVDEQKLADSVELAVALTTSLLEGPELGAGATEPQAARQR